MKIKTLAIAAATLAVGAITSQAQVYSQNIVGYVNQPIAGGKYAIVGTQFINGSDVNQTNGDINVTLGSGAYSSSSATPNTSTNTVLLAWNTGTSSFVTLYYYTASDADIAFPSGAPHASSGWYNVAGTITTIKLKYGAAAFIHNTAAIPLTNTCSGVVYQGTPFSGSISVSGNKYTLLNNVVPIVTNLVYSASNTQLPYGLPGASLTSSPSNPPTTATNDRLLIWNPGTSSYVTYYFFTAADADTAFPSGAPHAAGGFFNVAGTAQPTSTFPGVNVGYFLYHIGSTFTYTPNGTF